MSQMSFYKWINTDPNMFPDDDWSEGSVFFAYGRQQVITKVTLTTVWWMDSETRDVRWTSLKRFKNDIVKNSVGANTTS